MIFSASSTGLHGNFPAPADSASERLRRLPRSLPLPLALRSQNPHYCLLAFGPEAATHIWLVLDGATVHLIQGEQASAHPVVAESRWRECLIGDVLEADGTCHRQLRLLLANDLATLTMVSNGWGLKNFNYLVTNLHLSTTPAAAPVVHFGGPLSLQAALSEDEGPAYLLVDAGVQGIGPGAFAALSYSVAVQLQTRPVAEISFTGADGNNYQESVVLTYDSCVDGFHGCMRVGEGQGAGLAKIRVHFDAWQEASLAPVIIEVPVKRLEWPMHETPFLGAGCGTAAAAMNGSGPNRRETGLWI